MTHKNNQKASNKKRRDDEWNQETEKRIGKLKEVFINFSPARQARFLAVMDKDIETVEYEDVKSALKNVRMFFAQLAKDSEVQNEK